MGSVASALVPGAAPAVNLGRTVYRRVSGGSNSRRQALYDQEQERYQRALDQQQQDYERRLAERAQDQALQQFEVDRFEADAAARSDALLTDQTQERAKIAADRQSAERKRRNALRRAVARENAGAAARGIPPASGSAEAILLGLATDSDAESAEASRLDRLRLAAMADEHAALRRRNLLELTELTERHRIERMTWEV